MSYLTKLGRLSSLITLAACGAVLPAIKSDIAWAGPTSPSSYQASCQNISVEVFTDAWTGKSQVYLGANCRRTNGSFQSRTYITIRGIDNQDGTLAYSSNPTSDSTFQDSCNQLSVVGAKLSARCRRGNGSFKSTYAWIRGIDNQDGSLVHSR